MKKRAKKGGTAESRRRTSLRTRDIPAATRAALRKESGFGCALCGNPFVTYHHFDPPFAEGNAHDPAGMIALCLHHHARADQKGKDRGTYSTAFLHDKKSHPVNAKGLHQHLDAIPGRLLVLGAGIEAIGTSSWMSVWGVPRVRVMQRDGIATVDAFITNGRGRVDAFIRENEMWLATEHLRDAQFDPKSHRWLIHAGTHGRIELAFRRLSTRHTAVWLTREWRADRWTRANPDYFVALLPRKLGPSTFDFDKHGPGFALKRAEEWAREVADGDGSVPIMTITMQVPVADNEGGEGMFLIHPLRVDFKFTGRSKAFNCGQFGILERPRRGSVVPLQRINPFQGRMTAFMFEHGIEWITLGSEDGLSKLGSDMSSLPLSERARSYIARDFLGTAWSIIGGQRALAGDAAGAIAAHEFARDADPANRDHFLAVIQGYAQQNAKELVRSAVATASAKFPSDSHVMFWQAFVAYRDWQDGVTDSAPVIPLVRAARDARTGLPEQDQSLLKRIFQQLRHATQNLVELSLDLIVAMPQQTLEAEHYILDAVIPGTPVRWSLLVHSDWSIEFRSQDTEARTLSAHTDASILVPGQVTHLRVVVEVTDSLQSRIAMLINGVERATASLDALLLAPNAIEMYDMYSNRRWDGERQRWLIAVCEMMMIKRAWVSPDRESSLQYFLSKKNDDKLKGVSYDDGAFGLRARGEANLKFDGSTKQIVVQEWLAASTE